MAGKNLCPYKDGEDNLGKKGKAWGNTHTNNLYVTGEAEVQTLEVQTLTVGDTATIPGYVKDVTKNGNTITVTKGGGETNTFDAGMTKEQLTNFFYPVGSVYVSADKNKTKAGFPFMQYGTWEEVPANLCLQTGAASEAGTQRSAGLPNITGQWSAIGVSGIHYNSGAGYIDDTRRGNKRAPSSDIFGSLAFDASKSNPIYGSSDTVQPPAYMVRAWVRTA